MDFALATNVVDLTERNALFQSLGRMELSLREERIVWPGGRRRKPSGLMIPTHLKVITQPEKPFVYFRPLGQELVVAQGDDNFVTSNLDEGEACFVHGFHTGLRAL